MPDAESNAMPEGCDAIITPGDEPLFTDAEKAELEELAEEMSGPPGRVERTQLDPMWYKEQLDRIESKCDQTLNASVQVLAAARILLEQVKAIAEADSEEG